MKTREEATFDLLEEDKKYGRLVKRYKGNQAALAEADFLYQEGVLVDEIARALSEDK